MYSANALNLNVDLRFSFYLEGKRTKRLVLNVFQKAKASNPSNKSKPNFDLLD